MPAPAPTPAEECWLCDDTGRLDDACDEWLPVRGAPSPTERPCPACEVRALKEEHAKLVGPTGTLSGQYAKMKSRAEAAEADANDLRERITPFLDSLDRTVPCRFCGCDSDDHKARCIVVILAEFTGHFEDWHDSDARAALKSKPKPGETRPKEETKHEERR